MKTIHTLTIIVLSILAITKTLHAQIPGGKGNFTGMRQQMPTGRFYGKIVDEKTKKGIPYTPVQLFITKWDSISKSMKTSLAGGQLTEDNGDFSISNLSVTGKYMLKVAALGYKPLESAVAFDIKPPQQGRNSGMSQIAAVLDKDLGNIKLSTNVQQLKEAVIDGSAPSFKMEIDKKVYSVDKNPVNTGGTAQDVMKNIPTVNVDVDGNVTMRNASPQIFVDGRPTTLTLDQIPADAIDKVELITNPSAKYDAGDGGAGIINIVMKQNRQVGYNGSIRMGVDKRGKILSGLDLNVREGKINFFMTGSYNQRKSIGYGETERHNLFGSPITNIFQTDNSSTTGFFGLGKIGVDYFIDNRNTLTISPMYHEGHFEPGDELATHTDTIHKNGSTGNSSYNKITQPQRSNKTYGGSMLYKHLFTKQGEELTADVNYQNSLLNINSNYQTQYYNAAGTAIGNELLQQQIGSGRTQYTTIQSDYVRPINENTKIESGFRAAVRNFNNSLDNFVFSYAQNAYQSLPVPNSNYQFTDQVYAGYLTYSGKIGKWGYQGGLRVESSNYGGKITDTDQSYKNMYPISLFPSGFVNYVINDNDNVQLSYSRRINRPGFFQLIPYTDYSDSLNLRRGNPNLKPQFTNACELNYQHLFNRFNNFIASIYYKQTSGIITSFQEAQFDATLKKTVIISTYENANSAYSYGIELTSKNGLGPFLDVTSNINLYNAHIDGSNLQSNLNNDQFSWFGKMNLNMRLPKGFSIQLSGDYNSKTALPVGGSGGGGGGFGGGPTSNAQGYIKPRYGVDAALKYDFLKNRMASIVFNVSDVFKTRTFDSHSESVFFIQDNFRYRDQQFWRLIFSYRFGKYDVSLFKRKNNKNPELDDSQGM